MVVKSQQSSIIIDCTRPSFVMRFGSMCVRCALCICVVHSCVCSASLFWSLREFTL